MMENKRSPFWQNCLAWLVITCLVFGCEAVAFKAWEEEADLRPLPSVEFLLDRCNQGEETACEAYLDRRFDQTYGKK